MLEDDYNVSALYTSKKYWLESLRYNLDVAVEYEDISEETADKMYEQAKRDATKKVFEPNGFYYCVNELGVLYQDEQVIIIYNDYRNEVMIYTENKKPPLILKKEILFIITAKKQKPWNI